MTVVAVHWVDAYVSTDEITIKKAEKLKAVKTVTVGFLLAESDDGLVIAMDKWPKSPKQAKAYTFIPWEMVEEWYDYGEDEC